MRRRPQLLEEVRHGGQERGRRVAGLDVVQGAQRGHGEGHGHEVPGEGQAVQADALAGAGGVSGEVFGLGLEQPWRFIAWGESVSARSWIVVSHLRG